MTTFVFANNVNTTLASGISSSATSITLSSSANLPASIPGGSYLAITLNDAATRGVYEIVYATAVSGATLTVVRGQEGTSASAWLAGDYVFSGPTAGQMESFASGTGVTSFNTRTGAVTLTLTDVDDALGYVAANDVSVVHIAGTETITGSKTFTNNVGVTTSGSNGSLTITDAGSAGANVKLVGGGSTPTNKYIRCNAIGNFSIVNNAGTGALLTIDDSGNGTFAGTLTCTTSNATGSDRRLKHNIRKAQPLPLHRLVRYVSFIRNADGSKGRGVIAQSLRKHRPEYVGTFEVDGKTRLSVDMTSLAYEQAVWASQEVDRLTSRVEKLERSLANARIEPRKRGFVRRLLEAIW